MLRLAFCALILVSPALLAEDKTEPDDPKAPKAREIDLKGVEVGGEAAGPAKPNKVTKPAELDAYLGKEAKEAVLKQVNLKKEYLVVFRWAGSGGDRVTLASEGDKATFSMKRGLTRDLRQHFKVFALPTKATFEMAK